MSILHSVQPFFLLLKKKMNGFSITLLKDSFCCSQPPSSGSVYSTPLLLGLERGRPALKVGGALLPRRLRFETLGTSFCCPVMLFSKMKACSDLLFSAGASASSPCGAFGLGEEQARGMKVDISLWLSKVS